jgi:hypothetical protein
MTPVSGCSWEPRNHPPAGPRRSEAPKGQPDLDHRGCDGSRWLLLLAFLVKVPEPHLQEVGKPPPSVGILDPVIVKATMLSDPTPLFLPTQFNSSRRDYVAREPGGAFSGFPPKLTFDEAQLDLQLPSSSSIPASPAEALAGDPPGAPFLGFGRRDPVTCNPFLPERPTSRSSTPGPGGWSTAGRYRTPIRPPLDALAAYGIHGRGGRRRARRTAGPDRPLRGRRGGRLLRAVPGRDARVGQRLAPGLLSH